MSDLLDVEKSLRWETRLSLHIKNACVLTILICGNSDSLVVGKVGLYIKVIYYMYKPVQYTSLLAFVICNILIICNFNMALHLKLN